MLGSPSMPIDGRRSASLAQADAASRPDAILMAVAENNLTILEALAYCLQVPIEGEDDFIYFLTADTSMGGVATTDT